MKKLIVLLIVLFLVNGAMAQWFPQNSGTTNSLNSVFFTANNTGYIAGDSGTILKTTDGGENWIVQNSGTIDNLFSVNFPNESIGYVVGNSGRILKTTDEGVNWTVLNTDSTYSISSVFFTDANIGYAVGAKPDGWGFVGIILKTQNGGIDWTICYTLGNLTYGSNINSIYFTGANTGYAAGRKYGIDWGPVILKTVNAGLDWNLQSISVFPSSVYFPDTATGYIVGEAEPVNPAGSNITKTTNSGLDWTYQTIGTDFVFNSVYFTDVENGYVVGMNGIIINTTNSGAEWTIQYSGTVMDLYSVYFAGADTGYTTGNGGTILKTTNGGYVGIYNQPSASNCLKIYPNPSSDKITIETSAEGYLSIQNLSGQRLLNQHISKPSNQIDITNLPAGVYFVKLKNENTVEVTKLIKE